MPKPVSQFTLFGEYNWNDPIFKVLRRETASPRFKVYMMQKGMLNKLFYQYTDMLALQSKGDEDIDGVMRKQRRVLIDEGIVTEANEKMKENFENNNHAHKDLEEEDFRYCDVWCG